MLIEVPYELYQEIKHLEGVKCSDLQEVYLKNQIEYVMDSLGIVDDSIRERIMQLSVEEFCDYNRLEEDLECFIDRILDKEY